jgi:hypothetical protein
MPKPVYIICSKCGSDRMSFKRNEECGVYLCCDDCATITFADEYNDWIYEQYPELKKEDKA